MKNLRVSGMFLLATWRLAFSLLIWIFTIVMFIMIFRCIKALALAIKDQGMALLTDRSSTNNCPNNTCTVTRLRRNRRRSLSGTPTHSYTPPSLSSPSQPDYLPPNTPYLPPGPPPYSSLSPPPSYPPDDIPHSNGGGLEDSHHHQPEGSPNDGPPGDVGQGPPGRGEENPPPSYESLYPYKESDISNQIPPV